MLKTLSILIVDDDPINREVAEVIVSAEGHRVAHAADGQEAVEAARAQPFDVILMDITMPVMDGLAATRANRALNGAHEPTIIYVTGSTSGNEVEKALAAGGDRYIRKPIRRKDLLGAIEETLRAKGQLGPDETISR